MSLVKIISLNLYLLLLLGFTTSCDPIKNSFLSDYTAKDPCEASGCIDSTAKAQDLFIVPNSSTLVVKKLPETIEISGTCSASYYKKHIISIIVYSGSTDSSASINRNNDICNDSDVNNDRCIVPTHDSKTVTLNSETFIQCTRGKFSAILPAVTSCPASPATCAHLVTFQLLAGDDSYDENTSAINQTIVNYVD